MVSMSINLNLHDDLECDTQKCLMGFGKRFQQDIEQPTFAAGSKRIIQRHPEMNTK